MELITVIAIIAIAAAVLTPAISSITKASSRRAAASMTLSTVDQIRALALSHNKNYYLVFASNDPSWPEEYRCRAFAIFEEVFSPTDDPAQPSYHWLPATEWKTLPVGVAFSPSAASVFGYTPTSPAAPKSFYFRPLGKEMPAVYIKFNGIGAIEEPMDSSMAFVRIFEGYVNAAGNRVLTNQAAKAEEVIKISLVTGRAKRLEPEEL